MENAAEKLTTLINDLAEDFKPTVSKIESGPKTTQNHYGRYMSLLSTLSDGNHGKAKLFRLALLKAGANQNGVDSAMKVLFP